MNPKHLYVLVGVLALLIALNILSEYQDVPPTLHEQVELRQLLPKSMMVQDVTAVEFISHAPDPMKKKEEADASADATAPETPVEPHVVRLEKRDDARWVIATTFDSPAKGRQLTDMLVKWRSLQGDLVTEDAAKHADYAVDDAQAVRVRIMRKGNAQSLELLIGTARGSDGSFVRLPGENAVYLVRQNLRQDLGMWDVDTWPLYNHWLETTVLTIPRAQLQRVELTYPDHVIALEQVETMPAGEADASADAPVPGKEWRLASRSPIGAPSDKGLNDLLKQLEGFRVEDVLDPSRKEEFGLDKPTYRCVLTIQDGESTTTREIIGVRNLANRKCYLMDMSDPGRIYKLGNWAFDKLWVRGQDMFALKALKPRLDRDEVNAIEIRRGEDRVRLAKQNDGSWTVTDPQTGFMLQADTGKRLLNAIYNWQPVDFTDPAGMVQYGLNLPAASVRLERASGQPYELLLGIDHPSYEGAYVSYDAKGMALLMESRDVESIFLELSQIFDIAKPLMPIHPNSVGSLVLNRVGEPQATIRKDEGGAWVLLREGEESRPVDEAMLMAWLTAIAEVKAVALPGKQERTGAFAENAVSSLRILTTSAEVLLQIGKKAESGRIARVSSEPMAVALRESDAEAVLIDPTTLIAKPREAAVMGPAPDAETTAVQPSPADLSPVEDASEDAVPGKPVSVSKIVPNPFASE